ncbi:hypothetical protein EDB19DRAFT_1905271 [Suillus lakei]|nr:hypothetical protein EDB19DRAFT_1905271 [Suillus lakei]
MAHIEHREDKGSMAQVNPEGQQNEPSQEFMEAAAASLQARQRCRIVQLEEKLEAIEPIYGSRKGNQVFVALFNNVKDLVTKNDRRYDLTGDEQTNVDQDRLQVGYVALTHTLPWFHKKGMEMEYDKYSHMMKMLQQGADGARGDDTSKLKALVSKWVNREFKPDHPVDPDDKHSHGFTNNACGRLLCPAEIDWNDPVIRAGIQDCAEGHIVMDLSFPAFLYNKYTTNLDNLEEGLFKGKILLQGYKAVFMSPSSAKDIKGDGDGADVIQNNRLTKKSSTDVKVKKHVAQIIKMRKVTPHSIAYIACQIRFALSSVTLWWSVDGDFDYIQFWQTIMDFFKQPPGREAHCRVDRLLEWWTRKVFGRSHCNDLSTTAKANMSVNTLARQRAQRNDLTFDSP